MQLDRRFRVVADAQTQLLQAKQILAQLGCRALGCGTGIVQFVHQAGGQRAQRNQLFAMQRFHV